MCLSSLFQFKFYWVYKVLVMDLLQWGLKYLVDIIVLSLLNANCGWKTFKISIYQKHLLYRYNSVFRYHLVDRVGRKGFWNDLGALWFSARSNCHGCKERHYVHNQ